MPLLGHPSSFTTANLCQKKGDRDKASVFRSGWDSGTRRPPLQKKARRVEKRGYHVR